MRCYPDMSTAEELAVLAAWGDSSPLAKFADQRENSANFVNSGPAAHILTFGTTMDWR
jgi:hypothetical protein